MLQAGGWAMAPLILCSVLALAIIAERLWSLRRGRVIPKQLLAQVWQMARSQQLDATRIDGLRQASPLGRVLAAGLLNQHSSREVMKECIEETGRHVVHELARYLNTLGTIAAITPLLGLLGSVTGLMHVFDAMNRHGAGNPQALAGGISEIMLATAAGLAVAIPSLIFYRYFQGLIEEHAVRMEQEALKLVEIMHGESVRTGKEAAR
jgi:biopolymer transport protein ExbB